MWGGVKAIRKIAILFFVGAIATVFGAPAPEGRWIGTQREMIRRSEPDRSASCELIKEDDCNSSGQSFENKRLQSASESVRSAIDELLDPRQKKTHKLKNSAGEGIGHFNEQPIESDSAGIDSLNCQTSLERIFEGGMKGSARMCVDNPVARYLPGMEDSFFGRVHYFETQGRPNLISRGIARDVTACVSDRMPQFSCGHKNSTYSLRVTADSIKNLIENQIKRSSKRKEGELFASGLLNENAQQQVSKLIESDCALVARTYAAGVCDWPYDEANRLLARSQCALTDQAWIAQVCSRNGTKRAELLSAYLSLVEAIKRETLGALKAKPLVATVPCVRFRDDQGTVLDPNREFPENWKNPKTALMVSFIQMSSDKGTYVSHHGFITYDVAKKRFMLNHSTESGQAGGGFQQFDLADYIANSKKFGGMNILAPDDR